MCKSDSHFGALPELPPRGQGTEDSNGDSSDDSSDEEGAQALTEAVAGAWARLEGLAEADKARLQCVARLNSLGFYTHSEQLCHHGTFTALTGSGIFALASGFNHCCDPNVARFSLGDITAFVTNRAVEVGEELRISYIETELLCAPRVIRAQSLDRDFSCACSRCETEPGWASESSRRYFCVDEQLQASLALLPPQKRVETVEALLRGKRCASDVVDMSPGGTSATFWPAHEEPDEGQALAEEPLVVLGKDAQELRVVQALAFMHMRAYQDALGVWRRVAAFTCNHCPPFDEAVVVYATQASLCCLAEGKDSLAEDYASIAASCHRIVCGTDLFRWRYNLELEGSEVGPNVRTRFWELRALAVPPAVMAWPQVVAAWKFTKEEVPKAYDVV